MRVFNAEKNGIGLMWLWSVPVQNERRKFCLREHYFCGWLAAGVVSHLFLCVCLVVWHRLKKVMDKALNFLGSLFHNRTNLAVDLLQQGYASIFGFRAA